MATKKAAAKKSTAKKTTAKKSGGKKTEFPLATLRTPLARGTDVRPAETINACGPAPNPKGPETERSLPSHGGRLLYFPVAWCVSPMRACTQALGRYSARTTQRWIGRSTARASEYGQPWARRTMPHRIRPPPACFYSSPSTLAAQMKSFSDNPPTLCVLYLTRHLLYATSISG